MRPEGSPAELERRRLRAVALIQDGYSLNEVARRMGCNASSAMRWRNAFRRGGKRALRPKPIPGRPPRLTRRQKVRLVQYLLKGSLAYGYQTDIWTTLRIAELIRSKFGIHYHRDHVGRLLHSLDWTCQKPEKRATQRNEAAIEAWKQWDWPRIKKTRRGWRPISPLSTNPDTS
jgi:transposase